MGYRVMTNNQKGLEFERKCYKKLKEIGFSDLQLTRNTDNGADIVGAYNGQIYAFQCKDHGKRQGNGCVQEAVAARRLYRANRCVVISSSGFTPSAIALAKANNCILLTASDFWELHDFPPVNYSALFYEETIVNDFDYGLQEEYEKIRKNLHRTPKWDELDKHLQYRIRKKYRNYSRFLAEIGDTPYSKKPPAKEIKEEYRRIRSIINRIPTLSDVDKHSSFSRNLFKEYPFTKLQKECGDRPNIERNVTKEQLVDAYFALQEELGHSPTIKEIDGQGMYRSSYYRRRWGSIDGFLDSIGKSRTEAGLNRVYSEKEIIVIYSLIKILLSVIKESTSYKINHTVLEQLQFEGKSLISPSTISKKFGGWDNFLQYIQSNGIDLSLEKTIKHIQEQGSLFLQE